MAPESDKEKLLREILVAIDTSPHSEAALEAAVALAEILEANIQGLFVQNELWERLSELPSTTAISELTGREGPFEQETVEEQMKLLRSRLRRKLKYVSSRHRVTHNLRFTRGRVEEEVLEAARRVDLITIGWKGHSARGQRLGSSARAIIREADKPVLILEKGLRLGTVLTVAYDASEESRKGLRLALEIAQKKNSTLNVLVFGEADDELENRYDEVRRMLDDARVFAEVELMGRPDLGGFINAVYRQRCGLLIMPRDLPMLAGSLETVLRHIGCPLLLVK